MEFKEEKRGYCKEQVDAYIKTINSEYEKLSEEYQSLLAENEEEKNDTSNKDAIASALINAQLSGKQIVDEANIRARLIVEQAGRDAEHISNHKQAALSDIKKLSAKLSALIEGNMQEEEDEQDGEKSEGDRKGL